LTTKKKTIKTKNFDRKIFQRTNYPTFLAKFFRFDVSLYYKVKPSKRKFIVAKHFLMFFNLDHVNRTCVLAVKNTQIRTPKSYFLCFVYKKNKFQSVAEKS